MLNMVLSEQNMFSNQCMLYSSWVDGTDGKETNSVSLIMASLIPHYFYL